MQFSYGSRPNAFARQDFFTMDYTEPATSTTTATTATVSQGQRKREVEERVMGPGRKCPMYHIACPNPLRPGSLECVDIERDFECEPEPCHCGKARLISVSQHAAAAPGHCPRKTVGTYPTPRPSNVSPSAVPVSIPLSPDSWTPC